MINNTNVKVANKNVGLVESIKDWNEGYPSQKNRGKWYRYTVTFIDGETYESNRLSDIRHWISYRCNNEKIISCV